jgi:hypothetical protein
MSLAEIGAGFSLAEYAIDQIRMKPLALVKLTRTGEVAAGARTIGGTAAHAEDGQRCEQLADQVRLRGKRVSSVSLAPGILKGTADGVSALPQIVVHLIAKVADAYTLDQERKRRFRPRGSIAYDTRILSWNMTESRVSLWSLEGRLGIPFVCGERQSRIGQVRQTWSIKSCHVFLAAR